MSHTMHLNTTADVGGLGLGMGVGFSAAVEVVVLEVKAGPFRGCFAAGPFLKRVAVVAEERVDLLTGCPLFVEDVGSVGCCNGLPADLELKCEVVVVVDVNEEFLGGAETRSLCWNWGSRYPCRVQVVLFSLSTVVVKSFDLLLLGRVVVLGICDVVVDVATDCVDVGGGERCNVSCLDVVGIFVQ